MRNEVIVKGKEKKNEKLKSCLCRNASSCCISFPLFNFIITYETHACISFQSLPLLAHTYTILWHSDTYSIARNMLCRKKSLIFIAFSASSIAVMVKEVKKDDENWNRNEIFLAILFFM